MVDVAAPAGAPVDSVRRGPGRGLGAAAAGAVAGRAGGLERFAFELDGLPPGATPTGQP